MSVRYDSGTVAKRTRDPPIWPVCLPTFIISWCMIRVCTFQCGKKLFLRYKFIFIIDVYSLQGLTPLFYTAVYGGDPYCCEILLNDQAELHIADHQGKQEIHLVKIAILFIHTVVVVNVIYFFVYRCLCLCPCISLNAQFIKVCLWECSAFNFSNYSSVASVQSYYMCSHSRCCWTLWSW